MGARNRRPPQQDGEIPKQLHGIDAFTLAVDPIEMEYEIAQANRLHEEIDKTIKRLTQVKAYAWLLA
jgi:hypothetical protein